MAGAITGYTLARSGVSVLILEAGPRVDRAKATVLFRNSPTKGPNSPYPAHPWCRNPTKNDIGAYYVQAGPVTFHGLQARVVGGTTWHWGGLTLRYRPNDFVLKSKFGVGMDWPSDLHRSRAMVRRGRARDRRCGPPDYDWGSPRSTPYPMPPIAPTYLDTVIRAACSKVGLTMAPFPHGRNSVGRDGRPPCCGNASCVPICPIGAKYDASVHVAKAEAAGVRVEPLAIAHEIVVGDGPQGQRDSLQAARRQRGRGARQDVRDRGARGRDAEAAADVAHCRAASTVANSSDQVGRNLLTQLDAGMAGLTKDKLYPVSRSGRDERHPRAARWRLSQPARRVGHVAVERRLASRDRTVQGGGAFAAQGLSGAGLAAAVSDHMARELAMGPSVECLPNPDNRVTLAIDQLDPLGLPRPRIAYKWGKYEMDGMKVAMEYVLGLMNALGATELQTFGPVTDSAVMGGTCRMGDDPRTSVVDRTCDARSPESLSRRLGDVSDDHRVAADADDRRVRAACGADDQDRKRRLTTILGHLAATVTITCACFSAAARRRGWRGVGDKAVEVGERADALELHGIVFRAVDQQDRVSDRFDHRALDRAAGESASVTPSAVTPPAPMKALFALNAAMKSTRVRAEGALLARDIVAGTQDHPAIGGSPPARGRPAGNW